MGRGRRGCKVQLGPDLGGGPGEIGAGGCRGVGGSEEAADWRWIRPPLSPVSPWPLPLRCSSRAHAPSPSPLQACPWEVPPPRFKQEQKPRSQLSPSHELTLRRREWAASAQRISATGRISRLFLETSATLKGRGGPRSGAHRASAGHQNLVQRGCLQYLGVGGGLAAGGEVS